MTTCFALKHAKCNAERRWTFNVFTKAPTRSMTTYFSSTSLEALLWPDKRIHESTQAISVSAISYKSKKDSRNANRLISDEYL